MNDLSEYAKAAGIDDAEVAKLLSQLVAVPSVNIAFRQSGDPDEWFHEARVGAAIADWLRAEGIDVEIDMVAPERPNVIARVKGSKGAPSMLWEGHLDTVQVTGMAQPFTPRVENGRLYGRGAVDDKACLVAFMLALRDLARDPPPGDVTFLAASDEEFGFTGITHHMQRPERYDMGIAGEPTELRVVRACKGCVRWHVDVLGRAAHTAKPHEGVDAVKAARKLLDLFEEEMKGRTENHPRLGPATLTCTQFEAGEGPNTVPSRTRLRFDYRYLPSERGAEVWKSFKAIADSLAAAISGLRVETHDPFIDSAAMDVAAEETIVGLMSRVCAQYGIDPEPEGVPYGSDSTKMVMGGIPTIVFGPGNIVQAHSLNEYVEIAHVTKSASMLVAVARSVQV
ncbi:M20 family metallopeptidase [Nordella sp. HKS 07]|uniref:M20 family metallopeptidase n=1 Tax=Nordella sp. HKS 07 TaxID=2712222 RepID=UPI0013E1CAB8|nr:M20/M25/M40 family metallo-hydrolase [Nordella sp. HKS 07]QIG49788.1 M20 family metallopeptidase [Nordella sp. HKS 07]